MSSSSSSLFIPQLPAWLLRIASAPRLQSTLLVDPVAFAGWYATAQELVKWPEDVRGIQTAEREKKLSLDRMVKLLTQVNYAFTGQPNAARARLLLEGYAVHEWVVRNATVFQAIVGEALPKFESLAKDLAQGRAWSDERTPLQQLAEVLGLKPLELDILCLALTLSATGELSAMLSPFTKNRWTADALWTTMFNVTRDELTAALRPQSALRLSGLLLPSGDKTQLVRLSSFWLDLLLGEDNLFDTLLEPVEPRNGAGAPARMLDEDLALAADIVRNATDSCGVNLLLYGASRLDKRQLLKAVVERAERRAFKVRKFEDASRSDRPSLVYVAQRLLARNEPKSVLVVERPADALTTAPSDMLRMLFGIEFDPAEERPFDENLLATNQVPTVWLASSVSVLPDETVARFVFHAPLKKADRRDRLVQLEGLLDDFKLTRAAREEILKLDGVSAVQLTSAIQAAKLVGAKTRKERDAIVVQAVRRSQRALSRDVTAKMKPSVTQYSLKYLNTAGRFKPEDILRCLKNNPKGSLAFYGLPGTGKTQFVEYLAAELGLPLVSKKASDLLSKWLGESEKNIAAAFEEAASEDAILFIDEADSLLRDRAEARESWQVSQVNELLQHIERFEGIVVVCTNFFEGLDPAALRRFTFKVLFRELDADQRWDMFQVEAGLKGKLNSVDRKTRDDWWDRLIFMRSLTAGDFATVKRQSMMLGVELTPQEWLEQLQLECDVKKKSTAEAPRP